MLFRSGVVRFLKWSNDKPLSTLGLRFRLLTDKSVTHRGVWIDDVQLTGIPWSFDGDEYDYKRGTSMAAPVVAGIAGLIKSLNPALTHVQIKGIILDTADLQPSLQGRVASQGLVNAHQALLRASKEAPPATLISVQGWTDHGEVHEGQVVTVRVDFAPGFKTGSLGEMWVAADTPFGWFSYVFPHGWVSGIRPAIQGRLDEVKAFPVLTSPLPQGDYSFYFAVDESADGQAQLLWWDDVQVQVQ